MKHYRSLSTGSRDTGELPIQVDSLFLRACDSVEFDEFVSNHKTPPQRHANYISPEVRDQLSASYGNITIHNY